MLPVVPAVRTNAARFTDGVAVLAQDPEPLFTGGRVHRAATAVVSQPAAGSTGVVDLWRGVLAQYAAALDARRSFLRTVATIDDEGVSAPVLTDLEVSVSFVPPLDMPPLPAELAPLVDALLVETAELISFARDCEEATRPSVARQAPSRDFATVRDATLDRKL